jgi:hypothetical protein
MKILLIEDDHSADDGNQGRRHIHCHPRDDHRVKAAYHWLVWSIVFSRALKIGRGYLERAPDMLFARE